MSEINRERLRQYLLDLVQIDSHSREEGQVAARIRADLEALGVEVTVDDAGEKVGGDTGNVIARVKGTVDGAPPIFVAAHMDTVVPGKGVTPVIDGDIIRTDGTTVLGGDDKSGCAIIVECIRTLKERNIPHSDIDVLLLDWNSAILFRDIYRQQWVMQVGTQYTLNAGTKLRLGYAYAENPIDPDVGDTLAGIPVPGGVPAVKYLQAQFATINQHRIGAGVGFNDIVTGVDLPTIFPSETAVTQTPAQMYEAHWAREHAADLDAAGAAALQVHFDREHAAELAPIRYGR